MSSSWVVFLALQMFLNSVFMSLNVWVFHLTPGIGSTPPNKNQPFPIRVGRFDPQRQAVQKRRRLDWLAGACQQTWIPKRKAGVTVASIWLSFQAQPWSGAHYLTLTCKVSGESPATKRSFPNFLLPSHSPPPRPVYASSHPNIRSHQS